MKKERRGAGGIKGCHDFPGHISGFPDSRNNDTSPAREQNLDRPGEALIDAAFQRGDRFRLDTDYLLAFLDDIGRFAHSLEKSLRKRAAKPRLSFRSASMAPST